ncbi:late endosomal/lysosomal adaptor and MAPK and MTOR activator domain-containing protein [Phthorimaea operculella]|nr:late endosomal/lysosomal adaptor and MAPK and MTOR activator domain-containing protein [Phthorimaea operculella]
MQGDGEENLLHSCFDGLKSAVMGCCYSICHKENDAQENIVNERTHLLEVAEQQQETPTPAASASTPPRKPDEQSALNRILHETATNVIDVGALGPYALEPVQYNERDVPHAERAQILSKPGLDMEDKKFITNHMQRVAAAISSLRVEHHEELVVPFRVP